MSPRFRRGGFRRGRRFREPVVWTRGAPQSILGGAGPAIANVFLPESFTAGGVDSQLTLRRLHLNYSILRSVVTTEDHVDIYFGVYLDAVDAPSTKNPALLTAAESEVDWLDLWHVPVRRADVDLIEGHGMSMPQTRDIRAQRKVQDNQQIRVVGAAMDVATAPPSLVTDGSWVVNYIASALFSRTSR